MTATIAVAPKVLLQAKADWDSSSDELDGEWRRLGSSSVVGFSSAVAAAVEAFREPWVAEIKAASRQADGYSSAIVVVGFVLQVADADAAAQVRSLLPYDYRNASIEEH